MRTPCTRVAAIAINIAIPAIARSIEECPAYRYSTPARVLNTRVACYVYNIEYPGSMLRVLGTRVLGTRVRTEYWSIGINTVPVHDVLRVRTIPGSMLQVLLYGTRVPVLQYCDIIVIAI